MPTYEYVCGACGHRFERFQKISDRPVRRCPSCGEPKAERQISAGAGLLFKGPGFYATDYRKPGPEKGDGKNEGKAEKAAKDKDGGGAGGKGGVAEAPSPGVDAAGEGGA